MSVTEVSNDYVVFLHLNSSMNIISFQGSLAEKNINSSNSNGSNQNSTNSNGGMYSPLPLQLIEI